MISVKLCLALAVQVQPACCMLGESVLVSDMKWLEFWGLNMLLGCFVRHSLETNKANTGALQICVLCCNYLLMLYKSRYFLFQRETTKGFNLKDKAVQMLKIADKGTLANAELTLKTFQLPALSYAGIK